MPKINVGFMSLFVAPMGTAYAVTDCISTSYCVVGATGIQPTNCKTMSTGIQYGNYCLYSCNTCKDGYTKVSKTENLTGCAKTYYDCQKQSTTTCTEATYSSSTCGTTPAYTLSNCSSSTKKCFGGAYVQTCNTCNSGYTRTSTTYTPSGCSNSYTYYYCKGSAGGDLTLLCRSDADCTDGVGTTNITGGTKTVTGSCNDELKCEYTTSVKCNANYYKSGSTCYSCPSVGGVAGLSAASSTRITSCYIPANTYIEDTLGKFIFTSDCYYDLGLLL